MSDQEALNLRDSVNRLHIIIATLTEYIEKDYLKRSEGYDKFTKKDTSRRRLILVLALIPVAFLFSVGGAVTTVSVCFLDSEPHPKTCEIIPGYVTSQEQSRVIVNEFRELQKRSKTNEQRIIDLENQLLLGN